MSSGRQVRGAALCAAPGLALGVAGLWHPHHLNASTAATWWHLHVLGLFVFPLVGVALARLVRDRSDPVAALVRVGAYTYATAYSALDVLSGIGAGFVTARLPAGAPRPDEVRSLFAIGGPMGRVGAIALVLTVLVLTLDGVRRGGAAGLVGLVGVAGALLVGRDHIVAPWGALGVALVGVATGAMVLVARSDRGT